MRVILFAIALSTPVWASPWTVVGEVVDGDTGVPLSGVEVQLIVPGAIRATASTDAGGSFILETQTSADCLSVLVPASGPYQAVSVPMVCDGDGLSIALYRKPFAVRGRAFDRMLGRPIPYLKVTLGRGAEPLQDTLTGADGSFRFELPGAALTSPEAYQVFVDELWVSADTTDYLPHVERDLVPAPGDPRTIRADLLLAPQRGLIRVECGDAFSRTPLRSVRLRMAGRLGQGWTETRSDGGGAAVFEVPVWERSDVPFEENRLRSDYFVECIDERYDRIRARSLMVPPGVAETPGLVVVLSLVESDEALIPDELVEGVGLERRSSYSVIRLDPAEAPPTQARATEDGGTAELEAELRILRAQVAELEERLSAPRSPVAWAGQ
jgi:hypothetical protein